MLASETAITGDTWKAGFTNVNLNPDTELPIEIWLSKMSEQLCAAGEGQRLICSNYNPTDEEVMMEHGKKHLRAIKVPPLYAAMESVQQKSVLAYFSAPGFSWTTGPIRDAPFAAELKLTSMDKLSAMFKFVQAMIEAVNLGVADHGQPVPDWSLSRLKNDQLERERQHSKPNGSNYDLNGSKETELVSYLYGRLANETQQEYFSRLCLKRSLSGPFKIPSTIDATKDQISLFSPTPSQLTTGALLREANTNFGAQMGLRRLNCLGEVDGLCRTANSEPRVAKLVQAATLAATVGALLKEKHQATQKNKKRKQAELRKKDGAKRTLALLLGVPIPAKKFLVAQLKKFIMDKLGGLYPTVAKNTSQAVIVAYLLAVHAKSDQPNGVSLTIAARLARVEIEQQLGLVASERNRRVRPDSKNDEEEEEEEEEEEADIEEGEEEEEEEEGVERYHLAKEKDDEGGDEEQEEEQKKELGNVDQGGSLSLGSVGKRRGRSSVVHRPPAKVRARYCRGDSLAVHCTDLQENNAHVVWYAMLKSTSKNSSTLY
jgi:hypothetical protein